MVPFKKLFHHPLHYIFALMVIALLLSCNTISQSQDSHAGQPTVVTQAQPTKLVQPTATLPHSESGNIGQVEVFDYIYTQDFSPPPPDWDLAQYINTDAEVNYSIKNGVFSWGVKTIMDTVVMKTPDPDIFLPEAGFLVTVATKIQSQDFPASSGIMFRIQDFENFYYAKLSDLGEVSAFALQNNQWALLAGPVKSDHFVPGQLNRLIVVDNNGHYDLQVNDYSVVNFTDDRFHAGSTGLITELNAGMEATFSFDDFRVMQMGDSAAVFEENPTAQPTAIDLGGAYLIYDGEINGVKYSIEHPANFTHSSADGWDEFCLDVHDSLCVGIRRPDGSWNDPEIMATDVMASLGSQVSNFNIYHQQHTVTTEGFTAYWVGCTYTWEGVNYESSRLFVVVQNVGFEIAGYGEPDMMKTYGSAIKHMMESFILVYN